MAFQVTLTDLAAQDITSTVDFLLTRSRKAAEDWLDTIEQAVESLSEMPQRAPLIPENDSFDFDYRHLIYKNHRIVFRVDEAHQQVFVVRVYSSKRAALDTPDLP